jgi:hypothetical protein
MLDEHIRNFYNKWRRVISFSIPRLLPLLLLLLLLLQQLISDNENNITHLSHMDASLYNNLPNSKGVQEKVL